MAKTAGSNAAMPMDNYQAESDAETMLRHHQIKSNPARHKAAVAHLKGKLAAMKGAIAEPGESKAKEAGEGAAERKAEAKKGIA